MITCLTIRESDLISIIHACNHPLISRSLCLWQHLRFCDKLKTTIIDRRSQIFSIYALHIPLLTAQYTDRINSCLSLLVQQLDTFLRTGNAQLKDELIRLVWSVRDRSQVEIIIMLQNLQLDLSILMIGLATLYSETETIQIQLIRIRFHVTLLNTETSVMDRNLVTLCLPSRTCSYIQVQVTNFLLYQRETITIRTSGVRSLHCLCRACNQNRSVQPRIIVPNHLVTII